MTSIELKEKCIALQRECYDKQNVFRKQYAIERNPVKIGDVVTDHYHTIRVEKMRVYGYPIPFMEYYGTKLTKQGIPMKRQPVRNEPVFQNLIKSINGEPYKYEED